jgi:undecaprenyl diphosphate synthase
LQIAGFFCLIHGEFMQNISGAHLPRHLAIIMDGNGRWAKAKMMRRIVGHRQGVETVRLIVEECSRLGIGYLTLYAFSAENWARPKSEVEALMALLKKFIRQEVPRMMTNNIRFNVIGDRAALPADINREIDAALDATAKNAGLVLTLALSYGSRQEITQAVRTIAADVAAGRIGLDMVTDAEVTRRLFTADLPDPDLLIRTSGEMRISNFLLWQLAYTELYFCDVNWPEFTANDLQVALRHFRERERRFGLTSDQLQGRK